MTFTKEIKKELILNCNYDKKSFFLLCGIIFTSSIKEIVDENIKIKVHYRGNEFISSTIRKINIKTNVIIKGYKNNLLIDFSKCERDSKEKKLFEIIKNRRNITYIINEHKEHKNFMKSCFILKGIVLNPRSTYHLEIKIEDETKQEELIYMLEKFNIIFKKFNSGKYKGLYLKDSEMISDFLRLIESNNSLLEFENSRIIKEVRNTINRKQNCELANLNKTISTAIKQEEAIKNIIKKKGFDFLPKNLQMIAEIRLNTENLSLREIGEKHMPKLNKSSVNYKLNKIVEISEKL